MKRRTEADRLGMRTEITCVLFDLDGTLLNTIADLAATCNYALARLNAPAHTIDEVRGMVGDGARKLLERALPANRQGEIETALAYFRCYYDAHVMDETTPYAGITDTVRELTRRGMKLGVVSNKPQYAVTPLVKRFFPEIEVAVGDGEGRRIKPAPDGCLAALAALGASSEVCVYVGDSEVDLATAKNLNMPCIAAGWGFRGEAFLCRHGAKYLARKPSDILSLLERIGREREV